MSNCAKGFPVDCVFVDELAIDRDRISELQAQLTAANARADAYRDTLRSIAANSCCEGCQEARRVAITALEQTP